MLPYFELDPNEHISVKLWLKFKSFHSGKCTWKCRLPKAAILSQPQCVKSHYSTDRHLECQIYSFFYVIILYLEGWPRMACDFPPTARLQFTDLTMTWQWEHISCLYGILHYIHKIHHVNPQWIDNKITHTQTAPKPSSYFLGHSEYKIILCQSCRQAGEFNSWSKELSR